MLVRLRKHGSAPDRLLGRDGSVVTADRSGSVPLERDAAPLVLKLTTLAADNHNAPEFTALLASSRAPRGVSIGITRSPPARR